MKLFDGVKKVGGKALYSIKKNSPEILIGVGIVAGVATVVTACKATLKVDEILAKPKEDLKKIHEVHDSEENKETYTEQDYKKDLAIVYTQTGVKLLKNYALPIALGALSVTSTLCGFKIIKGRYVAAASAYAILDRTYNAYRDRVISELGDEADKRFRFGGEKEVTKETVIDENGKETTKKKEVSTLPEGSKLGYSDNAREFSTAYTAEATGNEEYDTAFVEAQQRYLEDRLNRLENPVFLNDIYDALGFRRTKAGQVLGVVKNESNPDGKVDFGIVHTRRRRGDRYENVIIIDPKVEFIMKKDWEEDTDKHLDDEIPF